MNAIERRYHAYAADLKAAPGVSPDAAAAVAAHTVLVELYPQQKGTLDAALAASLAKIQDGPAKADGVALGNAAAETMLALRRNDKMSEKASFAPKSGPGAFQLPANANPIGPHWGAVTPFTLKNIEDFRLPGPPPLTSARYAQDFNEVKAVGAKNSTQRTAEQTAIATAVAAYEPDHLQRHAARNAGAQAEEHCRAGAGVCAAEHGRVGRVHCRAGATNTCSCSGVRRRRSATPTPTATMQRPPTRPGRACVHPFPAHPEYPSGHALFTGVAETVLRDFFGTDRMTRHGHQSRREDHTNVRELFRDREERGRRARVGGDSFPQRRH